MQGRGFFCKRSPSPVPLPRKLFWEGIYVREDFRRRGVARELLAGGDFGGHRIRLIGVTVGNAPDFGEGCVQLRFDFGEE